MRSALRARDQRVAGRHHRQRGLGPFLEHSRGEFRTGKPKGGAVQQLGILLIVEENAEMLVGGAGGSSSGAAWGSTQTVKESRQG